MSQSPHADFERETWTSMWSNGYFIKKADSFITAFLAPVICLGIWESQYCSFFFLRHNFNSLQTKHFIFIFINLYTYIIYTYTHSFSRVLEFDHIQNSCTVYFGDACEDTLFQHVFKFQNLTLHWYLTLLLYFRWGYFSLKHNIFTTHT